MPSDIAKLKHYTAIPLSNREKLDNALVCIAEMATTIIELQRQINKLKEVNNER